MTPIDEDYFTNATTSMDDWKYEMRREIQEIVVNIIFVESFFFLFLTSL